MTYGAALGVPEREDVDEPSATREMWDRLIREHDRKVVLSLLAIGVDRERARELAQATWTRLIEQHRDGKLAALELPGLAIRHECEPCARRVRDELELELRLGEVGSKATFCPGCSRLVGSQRCDACGAALVAGSYRIERVLVRTTHGRLYVARDENDHRVALKELAFIQTPSFEALAAFERETKFLRALQHPGIPKFHASFVHGTGIHTRFYLAQDLVEGESLLARLDTHWFDEREIVGIATRVLEVLVYLQNLSPMIFHRDVKPANLISLPDGSISLVDFGAARDVSETMGNTSIGTFGYMPVEQMGGIVDATTDTYALGASLLHLLTRREPWKLLEQGPVGVNVSAPLRKYLQKMVARRPQDRFPTARAALDALRALRVKPRRSFAKIAMLAASALVVAGGAIGATVMLRGKKDNSYMRDAIAKMDEFSQRMCGCRDKGCADTVNADMTRWGTEMARDARPTDERPDPEMAKRAADIMTRYTECMTKVMMIGAQQQQPAPQPEDPPISVPPPKPEPWRCPLADRTPTGGCAVKGPSDKMRIDDDASPATMGYVTITSKPQAKIAIDGVDTGKSTPALLQLQPGKHKIQFSCGNTKSAYPITVKANERLSFHKELE